MSSQNYVNAAGVVLSLTTTPTSQLDTIWAASGPNQTLQGNSGDDDFVIFDPTDDIVVPPTHGIYTVTDSAWDVSYTLPSGINNLILNGDLQVVSGNAQANLIETGSGRATVSGGGGDDVFVLGTGAVTVVDPQGSGSDVIYGFNTAIDQVQLEGSTVFTSWASIQAALTQSGSNVVLNMGNGQTLTFNNITVAAFSSTDFSYPFPTSTMRLTFDDEFNSFVSSPNGSVGWMTSWPYGGVNSRAFPGGQDSSYYSDSSVGYNPFKIVNGVLDITATTAAAAGGNPDNLPYDSGVITTYKSESQLYGYFEIRAETPAGQGLWPAFYLQSNDGTAELDVFEILGQSPNDLYVTATDHATGASVSQLVIIPNSTAGFHTYGVDWEPNTITFYVDGNAVASTPTPASMHVPMYMVVGLGVGASGSWAGPPSSSAEFPATLQVDYVRAYATAATQDVGGTAAIVQPITVTPSTEAVPSANDTAVHPFSGLVITDINASQTETATVTVSSTANGALSDPNAATDGSKIANGVLTVTGSAAAVATVLNGLVFTPASASTTTVTASVRDTAGQMATAVSTITSTAPGSSTPGTITSAVLHSGAPTDNPWGTGEGGVTVSLLNASGAVIATTVTANWGGFSFNGVNPGNYQLQYTPPVGQGFKAGAPENPTTGQTAQFTVAAGQTVTAPQGWLVSNTVNGSVLLSGVAEAGVSVSLLTTTGTVVATTTSGSSGAYTFTGMAAGSYKVAYLPPSGQAIAPAGPENVTTGQTAAFTVAAGQTVTAPTGELIANTNIISGVVTLNGAVEAGVAVSLLSTTGSVLGTTTTGSAGAFGFTGLTAGSYEVKFTAPSGQVLQTGSEANAGSGITPTISLASGGTVTLPTEQLLSNPATISSAVLHSGAPTDNSWGTGEGGVTVSLVNASGSVIATTVTAGWGGFSFGQIGPGTYQLLYTPPAGQGFKPGAPESAATGGLTAAFTVAAGQTVSAPQGWLMSTITMNGTGLTEVPPAGAYLVTGNASGSSLTLGSGNQYVTLTGTADTVLTGNGNQTIALSGTGNTITVGTGTSIIDAGAGYDTIHAAGGTVTITAGGAGNLFDSGPGMSFLSADGSANNVFMLNPAVSSSIGLTTITGFNPSANDVLDLKRTLAGTDILPDMSNIASLVTSSFSGGNTTLFAAPTGGGSPLAFAVLDGVNVTVAQLQAAHEFSIT